MTTDPRITHVRDWYETVRRVQIDAGTALPTTLIDTLLTKLDSANPLDGDAVERVARERFAEEYPNAAGEVKKDERRGYTNLQYSAEQLEDAFVDGYLAAAPKDMGACAQCGGTGEWRDGQTSGRCQACHGSGRVPKDGRALELARKIRDYLNPHSSMHDLASELVKLLGEVAR